VTSRRAAASDSGPARRGGDRRAAGDLPVSESRPKVRSYGFVGLALLGVALSTYVAWPLLGPILWAMTLAIVADPLHRRAERRFGHGSVAAAAVTTAIALLVALPFALVAAQLVLEAADLLAWVQSGEAARRWQESLSQHPRLAAAVESISRRVDLKALVGDWTGGAAKLLRGILAASIAAATGWLIMVFVLFFFLRDRARVLATVTRFLPLTRAEVAELFKVTADTVHATVYGTLGVALIQGTLGGLAFWWLGLPAPLLWGAVMAVLSVLPVLGAALVWMPAAAYLALQGQWADAILLSGFGLVVVGLIDNLVYPLIVKERIRLHAVPVFIAILGGLIAFGASGIVLGPLLLALTDELVKLWRRRLDGADPPRQTDP
jgi:predicted PurR-regulated permease PerM